MALPGLSLTGAPQVGGRLVSGETLVCCPSSSSRAGAGPAGVSPLRELRVLRGGDVRGLVLRPQVGTRLLGRLLQRRNLPGPALSR